MRAGYTVVTKGEHPNAKVIVVSNYESTNEVFNYRFTGFTKKEIAGSDIGMWRIKTLKK